MSKAKNAARPLTEAAAAIVAEARATYAEAIGQADEARREQIAAAVSIELNGSTMRARLAELRKLQLIEDVDKSTIKVQAWLADNWGRGA